MILANARLIDGTGRVLDKVNIVIKGETIDKITPEPLEGPSIDLEGETVIPGLIDAHTHLLLTENEAIPYAGAPQLQAAFFGLIEAPRRAKQLLAAGVTTIRDVGAPAYADIALREAIERGVILGPRMLVAGRIITITGGLRETLAIGADGVDEVLKATREQLKAGVDLIKLYTSGPIIGPLAPGEIAGAPKMSLEEMRAAVREAHNAGKKVAAHSQGTEIIKDAIRAGVDSIEHGVLMDEEGAKMMAEKGVYYVPTIESVENVVRLGVEGGMPSDYLQRAKDVVERHHQSFHLAREAGVKIVAGTDAGAMGAPTYGDLAMELEGLVRLGLSCGEALASATSVAAELLGIPDIGTVEEGKKADLVVLDQDPLTDISALKEVKYVVKRGRLLTPDEI